jgi:hypothetical protein
MKQVLIALDERAGLAARNAGGGCIRPCRLV